MSVVRVFKINRMHKEYNLCVRRYLKEGNEWSLEPSTDFRKGPLTLDIIGRAFERAWDNLFWIDLKARVIARFIEDALFSEEEGPLLDMAFKHKLKIHGRKSVSIEEAMSRLRFRIQAPEEYYSDVYYILAVVDIHPDSPNYFIALEFLLKKGGIESCKHWKVTKSGGIFKADQEEDEDSDLQEHQPLPANLGQDDDSDERANDDESEAALEADFEEGQWQ